MSKIRSIISTITGLFSKKQPTNLKTLRASLAKQQAKEIVKDQTDRHASGYGFHSPTRCRCFVRILHSPFCTSNPTKDNPKRVHRREVWCKKHHLYICLDCGGRDRISGIESFKATA